VALAVPPVAIVGTSTVEGPVYGWQDLKKQLRVTEATVACPVLGCEREVERQRRRFLSDERFICPEHGVYISPTTWKYPSEADNLLWTSPADVALLAAIKRDKRESRIAFDNSEDAVTFNVFRFLESRPELLDDVLSNIGGERVHNPRLIYWSHDREVGAMWKPLGSAREAFGESLARGSEPDLIVLTDETLFFIEAKLTSTNKTSAPKSGDRKEYLTGGGSLFARAFTVDWPTVSADRYELMRFWLLGSWLAAGLGLKFRLVSLLPMRQVTRLPPEHFADYVVQSDEHRFVVHAWEQIWRTLVNTGGDDEGSDARLLGDYFLNKTVGYGSDRLLRPAFQQPESAA
jgi:hypothetical protein